MPYAKILKRMLALFLVSALTTMGAGSIIGLDVLSTALLAGILGVANVVEELARGYLNDGKLSAKEIEDAFQNNIPEKKKK
jgi:hypothetical protein